MIGDSLENGLRGSIDFNSTATSINSVEINTFRLHKFPLFARSEFFKQKCEDEKTVSLITFYLPTEMLPGGNPTFKEIANFCYGLSPNLNAENVINIIVAAHNLGMTEEYSANNLIRHCEDFLKAEVFSSWESSLSFLEKVKDTSQDIGITEDVFRNCIEVVLEYAIVLNGEKPETTSLAVTGLFTRLVALSPLFLRGFLQGLRSKNLTFIYIGNYLAAENYSMVFLDECLMPSGVCGVEDPCSPNGSVAEINNTTSVFKHFNERAILEFFVESLGFSVDGFKGENSQFQIPYVVTLLKYCCKLESKYEFVLREYLSTKLDKCSLTDLQALQINTLVSLISNHFSTEKEKEKDISIVIPLEEEKKLSTVKLVDDYILWAATHHEGFQLSDLQTLVEILPDSFRESCDTLYDGIDSFLERNPGVNDDDVLRLCHALNPFKLSEAKTEMAVQNKRIPLQPGYFTTLYLAQNKELKSLKILTLALQEEMGGLQAAIGGLHEDLKNKDDQIAKLHTQFDILRRKNAYASSVRFP